MVTGESPFIILRNTHICELDPAKVRKQLLFRYVPTGLSTICWKLYSLVEINPFLVRWAQPSNAMDGQAGSPWACSARPTHCRQCGKGCRDSERCCFKNPQHCPKEIKSSERFQTRIQSSPGPISFLISTFLIFMGPGWLHSVSEEPQIAPQFPQAAKDSLKSRISLSFDWFPLTQVGRPTSAHLFVPDVLQVVVPAQSPG